MLELTRMPPTMADIAGSLRDPGSTVPNRRASAANIITLAVAAMEKALLSCEVNHKPRKPVARMAKLSMIQQTRMIGVWPRIDRKTTCITTQKPLQNVKLEALMWAASDTSVPRLAALRKAGVDMPAASSTWTASSTPDMSFWTSSKMCSLSAALEHSALLTVVKLFRSSSASSRACMARTRSTSDAKKKHEKVIAMAHAPLAGH
mmetsp:Transcript_67290/g.186441  ORF Transcript_67290/g.186441 Transcript_67290/m.186441 type:complete len:205 (+) Transcript_67290:334-948(+)